MPNPNSDADAYNDNDNNAYPDAYNDNNAYPDTYAYADTNANGDVNSDADSYANTNANADKLTLPQPRQRRPITEFAESGQPHQTHAMLCRAIAKDSPLNQNHPPKAPSPLSASILCDSATRE